MRSLTPVGRAVIKGIVLAAFVLALVLAVAKSVVVAVLAGLRDAAALIVIAILGERERSKRQNEGNCESRHPQVSFHGYLRSG